MNKYRYIIEVDLDEVVDFLLNVGSSTEYVDMLMSEVTAIVYDELGVAVRKYIGEGEDDE